MAAFDATAACEATAAGRAFTALWALHYTVPQVYFGSWPEVAEEGPQRYGPKAAGWVRVREGWTLRDVLARPDHVVPGVPTFFVLAKGTDFRDRFLEGDMPLI